MSTNINLLLHTDQESVKREKRIKILNFMAIMSLVVVGIISLSIFIFIQILNPESIKKAQGDVLVKISRFEGRQLKLFILNDRVENIDKILKIRIDLSKATSGLLAKIPSQLSVKNFEIDGQSVTITGQSGSLFAVGEFIGNFTDMVRNKEIIKSLSLNSLIYDQDKNTYQISVRSNL